MITHTGIGAATACTLAVDSAGLATQDDPAAATGHCGRWVWMRPADFESPATFQYALTRQFIEYDGDEQRSWQLSLTLHYERTPESEALRQAEAVWCFSREDVSALRAAHQGVSCHLLCGSATPSPRNPRLRARLLTVINKLQRARRRLSWVRVGCRSAGDMVAGLATRRARSDREDHPAVGRGIVGESFR